MDKDDKNAIELSDLSIPTRKRSNAVHTKPVLEEQSNRNTIAQKNEAPSISRIKSEPGEFEMQDLSPLKDLHQKNTEAQKQRNIVMNKMRQEIGSNRSPVMGEQNAKRDIGLMMQDARLGYEFDREEDHAGFFKGVGHSAKRALDDMDIGKTAVSMIPGVSSVSNARDAFVANSIARHLNEQKSQYSEQAGDLFKAEAKRQNKASGISALKALDLTPHGLLSKAVSYGSKGADALKDKQKKQRIAATQLESQLNEAPLRNESFEDNHEKRMKLATMHNDHLYDLTISEPKANQAARNLLETASVFDRGGHQAELKHHASVLKDSVGEQSLDESIDQSHTLKPSEIRRQVLSEQAIKNLRKK